MYSIMINIKTRRYEMIAFKAFLYRILAVFASIFVAIGSVTSGTGCAENELPTEFENVKNVILMIGDGMGFNSIAKTEADLGINLSAFDRFPLTGASKTSSASSFVTDSAAGGSALATGTRISNKSVAVYPDDLDAKRSYPMSLTELAQSLGKRTGVVTTAKTTDATPADFSAHVSYRDYNDIIIRQQCDSGIDLIWGARDNVYDEDYAASKGYTTIRNIDEMNALSPGEKSFGQFRDYLYPSVNPDESLPTLAQMTAKALELLENENGFFIMIEGAHIDKGADDMDAEKMEDAVIGFADAIDAAMDFAENTPGTMVIVTADHETGGIIQVFGKYLITTTMHTSKDVPLLVYGCDNFIEQDEAIKNSEVGRRIACAMGECNFPRAIKTN